MISFSCECALLPGKTTAINCIIRVLYPNAGSILVEGHSVSTDFANAVKHLGCVTQHSTLYPSLSCIDHLRLFARIRGVPVTQLEDLVQGMVAQMEPGPYRDRLAENLSGGMKRKLCVAVALIGDPDVVLLDEPSTGLDPVRSLPNPLNEAIPLLPPFYNAEVCFGLSSGVKEEPLEHAH